MKHLFIPYGLAVIAKEKGFNEPCLAIHTKRYGDIETPRTISQHEGTVVNGDRNEEFGKHIEFPTITAIMYQQIIDWLRDNHSIELGSPKNIIFNGGKRHFRVSIYKIGEKKGLLRELSGFNEYYEALNEAIKQALKLI